MKLTCVTVEDPKLNPGCVWLVRADTGELVLPIERAVVDAWPRDASGHIPLTISMS